MSKFPVALLLVLGWAFVPKPAFAEAKCPAGDAPIFAEDVRATASCEAAHKLHDSCGWGSSGDVALSGAVIENAKRSFSAISVRRQKRNYEARQQRCSDKYAREDGSLAVAEAALCTEAIAVSFARNAAAAGRVPAAPLAPVKASFDCNKARTELELLICFQATLSGTRISISPRPIARPSTARLPTPARRSSPARLAGSPMWRSRASAPRAAPMLQKLRGAGVFRPYRATEAVHAQKRQRGESVPECLRGCRQRGHADEAVRLVRHGVDG